MIYGMSDDEIKDAFHRYLYKAEAPGEHQDYYAAMALIYQTEINRRYLEKILLALSGLGSIQIAK